MKRYLVICILILILISGCSSEKLDYKSMYDLQNGGTISLGDTKSNIENKLGEQGVPIPLKYFEDFYRYFDETLEIKYTNGIAVSFESKEGAERFIIKGFSYDMAQEEITKQFTQFYEYNSRPAGNLVYKVYTNFYDEQGRIVSEKDDYIYEAHVLYLDDVFYGVSIIDKLRLYD